MTQKRPLVLFTNDDGVRSPGLHAAVAAFLDVADVLVVAPELQQSGMGRSMPITSSGEIYEHVFEIGGQSVTCYGVEGTPAQSVQVGVLEIAHHRPSLIVSGINYGENAGNGVTISGTVGAALEGAALGIPSIALSQQTPKDLHLTYSPLVDFSVAAQFARRFGLWMMQVDDLHTRDIDILKIDLPLDVTPQTEWRMTRVSRTRVYWPARHDSDKGKASGPIGYYQGDTSKAERDSDVYAVFEDKVVSVTPMSLDMTSRLDFEALKALMNGHQVTQQ